MTDADPEIACVHAYIAAFEAADPGAAASLFADDATVEDPFGSAAISGRDAIREFYARAMQGSAKLQLAGPVRLAGNAVAFPFTANVPAAGIAIDIIDVFHFDADGRIVSMQAFWGPANARTVDPHG
jgi:steroid delta-isomerase